MKLIDIFYIVLITGNLVFLINIFRYIYKDYIEVREFNEKIDSGLLEIEDALKEIKDEYDKTKENK